MLLMGTALLSFDPEKLVFMLLCLMQTIVLQCTVLITARIGHKDSFQTFLNCFGYVYGSLFKLSGFVGLCGTFACVRS